MVTTTLAPRTSTVLEFVNDARAELGLPPLDELRPGERLNPWYCPVCLSVHAGAPDLDVEFTGSTLRVWRTGGLRAKLALEIEAPEEVVAWCEDFDRGGQEAHAAPREVVRRDGSEGTHVQSTAKRDIIAGVVSDEEASMPVQVGQRTADVETMAKLHEAHRGSMMAQARREAAKRELSASRDALQEARTILWQAVRDARAGGASWGQIASVLGVSTQRAQALAMKPPEAARR